MHAWFSFKSTPSKYGYILSVIRIVLTIMGGMMSIHDHVNSKTCLLASGKNQFRIVEGNDL